MTKTDTGAILATLALGWAIGTHIDMTELVVGLFVGFIVIMLMIDEAAETGTTEPC